MLPALRWYDSSWRVAGSACVGNVCDDVPHEIDQAIGSVDRSDVVRVAERMSVSDLLADDDTVLGPSLCRYAIARVRSAVWNGGRAPQTGGRRTGTEGFPSTP